MSSIWMYFSFRGIPPDIVRRMKININCCSQRAAKIKIFMHHPDISVEVFFQHKLKFLPLPSPKNRLCSPPSVNPQVQTRSVALGCFIERLSSSNDCHWLNPLAKMECSQIDLLWLRVADRLIPAQSSLPLTLLSTASPNVSLGPGTSRWVPVSHPHPATDSQCHTSLKVTVIVLVPTPYIGFDTDPDFRYRVTSHKNRLNEAQ